MFGLLWWIYLGLLGLAVWQVITFIFEKRMNRNLLFLVDNPTRKMRVVAFTYHWVILFSGLGGIFVRVCVWNECQERRKNARVS